MPSDMKNFIDPVKDLREDENIKSIHKLNEEIQVKGKKIVYNPANKYNIRIITEKDEPESIIADALKNGATDDGQIVKWAYDRGGESILISSIKRLLRSMECSSKIGCPHKHDRMNFINVMTSCMGRIGGCSFLNYDLSPYYDRWKKNRDRQYGDSIGNRVVVEGKISKIKEVSRFRNDKFIHIHLFDTKLRTKDAAAAGKGRYTRDLWVEIPKNTMVKFDMSCHFCLEDTISVTGIIEFHKYFGDYWLGDVAYMEAVRRRGGAPAMKY